MYFPGTILELKEPRSVPEDKQKKLPAEPFPYDQVEVVGPSPVSYAGITDWDGVNAQGVILKPLTSFGGLVDEPFGKVMTIYKVVYEPDPNEVGTVGVEHVKLGPSPEDVFAREAGGVAKSKTRQKTPHSPL